MMRILFLCLTLLVPSLSWGAVAFEAQQTADCTVPSAGPCTSPAFTVTSANAAAVCLYSNTNHAIQSATIAGQTASAITGAVNAGNGNGDRVECWGAKGLSTGSQTATVTLATSETALFQFCVITASGVDQTTPFNNGANTINGFTNSVALTITSATGDMTFTAYGDSSQSDTTDKTNRCTAAGSTGIDSAAGSASNTHTWTGAGANWIIAAGANFKQAAGGGGDQTFGFPYRRNPQ